MIKTPRMKGKHFELLPLAFSSSGPLLEDRGRPGGCEVAPASHHRQGLQHGLSGLTRKLLHLDQGVFRGRTFQELLSQPAAARFQEPGEQSTICEVFLPKERRKLKPTKLLDLLVYREGRIKDHATCTTGYKEPNPKREFCRTSDPGLPTKGTEESLTDAQEKVFQPRRAICTVEG